MPNCRRLPAVFLVLRWLDLDVIADAHDALAVHLQELTLLLNHVFVEVLHVSNDHLLSELLQAGTARWLVLRLRRVMVES